MVAWARNPIIVDFSCWWRLVDYEGDADLWLWRVARPRTSPNHEHLSLFSFLDCRWRVLLDICLILIQGLPVREFELELEFGAAV